MKALVKTGENKAEVREVEKPCDKTVVKTLRVGIDGTDQEVLEEDSSIYPQNSNRMIIGHEAVGRVESSEDMEKGTLVAPTVRRALDSCPARFDQRPDLCAPGQYVERGIYRAHGYCSNYFADDAKHLVPVPEELESIGVLLEPTSIVVKAVDRALKAQERQGSGPETAVVLGAGSIGLLACMILKEKGCKVKAVDVVNRDHEKVRLLEQVGAEYVDNRDTKIEELEAPDLVLESSGVSEQVFTGLKALAPNGALVSVGLPHDIDSTQELETGKIHQELVLKNKALLGSVNSSRQHFKKAVDHLNSLKKSYPVGQMLDTRVSLENWEEAFDPAVKGEIVFEKD